MEVEIAFVSGGRGRVMRLDSGDGYAGEGRSGRAEVQGVNLVALVSFFSLGRINGAVPRGFLTGFRWMNRRK